MYVCMLVLSRLSHFHPAQSPTQIVLFSSWWVFSLQLTLLWKPFTVMTAGQPNLDTSPSKLSSQLTLKCVKLTIKMNTTRYSLSTLRIYTEVPISLLFCGRKIIHLDNQGVLMCGVFALTSHGPWKCRLHSFLRVFCLLKFKGLFCGKDSLQLYFCHHHLVPSC